MPQFTGKSAKRYSSCSSLQNPALIASLLVLGHSKDLSRSDIKVLSISTGRYERTKAKPLIGQAASKWGLVQWAPILIETVMSAGDRYTQVRAPLPILS